MCLSLGWTSLAHANELVEVLGPSASWGTVLIRAQAAAIDGSQLGFGSVGFAGQRDFDDKSGEFYLSVSADDVQVVFFSDDGVNVQVTDMGDTSDPLGPVTANVPGLSNLGVGQALPDLSQSLKLVPATFTPNHTYRFEWQFRNTYYTGDGDVDGMKVFVLGGAQLAAAPPKKIALFSPQTPPTKDAEGNLVPGSMWTIEGYPKENALVTPGSVFTLMLVIHEKDSLWRVEGNQTSHERFPFQLDEGKTGLKVTLTLNNATFGDNLNSATFELENVSEGKLELMPKPEIHVSPTLAVGDFVTLTVSSITDPGRIPDSVKDSLKNQGYEIAPNSTVTDPPMGELTVRWKRTPEGLLLPTEVEGVDQVNLPEDEHVVPFTEQEGRYILLTYRYLPDRNGEADPAGNYDGVMVREHYDQWAVGIEGKSFEILKDDVITRYRKPGDTVDLVFSKWIDHVFDKDVTFTIVSNSNSADFTKDHYQLGTPERALSSFFVESQKGKHVEVSARQRYECLPGSENWLGGHMHRMVRSSCDGVDLQKQPIAPKQRVSAL